MWRSRYFSNRTVIRPPTLVPRVSRISLNDMLFLRGNKHFEEKEMKNEEEFLIDLMWAFGENKYFEEKEIKEKEEEFEEEFEEELRNI